MTIMTMTKPLGTKTVFGFLSILLPQAQLVLDTDKVLVYVVYTYDLPAEN